MSFEENIKIKCRGAIGLRTNGTAVDREETTRREGTLILDVPMENDSGSQQR